MAISIHAPREGGDAGQPDHGGHTAISIHAPREGGDVHRSVPVRRSREISIHAPREGGDRKRNCFVLLAKNFNPRPPRGGRHDLEFSYDMPLLFQSTPPARGATGGACRRRRSLLHFNPRPPRGGRPYMSMFFRVSNKFQSTPPARGATAYAPVLPTLQPFQSTPPARGATSSTAATISRIIISIHAPREGGDYGRVKTLRPLFGFQSTPPARGATLIRISNAIFIGISIHAPREGGDHERTACGGNGGISIHAPREGGDAKGIEVASYDPKFQSTPPARGATSHKHQNTEWITISIHAPREGGDSKDAQFYLRIFDKQVELLRFLGIIRGGCLRNPEKDRRFSREKPCEPPGNLWSLGLRGGGKARPGYPCAVPLPRRAACVRGSGDPPADRCSSYRNAPLFSHIASPDSKSADCLSQNP